MQIASLISNFGRRWLLAFALFGLILGFSFHRPSDCKANCQAARSLGLPILKADTSRFDGRFAAKLVSNKTNNDTVRRSIAMPLSGASQYEVFLHAYPNPTTGLFVVLFDLPEAQRITITISSENGKTLFQHSEVASQARRPFDLTNYEPGIYSVMVQTADGRVFYERVIRQ